MAQPQSSLAHAQSQPQDKTASQPALPQASDKITQEAFQSLWDKEYRTLKTLPSSTRIFPSRSLSLFAELLPFSEIRSVLDAGCGIGRNAIYLARKGCRVHAVDCSAVALTELSRVAQESGVGGNISTSNSFLGTEFPFENGEFDLSLDCYVFCHFESDGFRSRYRDELHRVTRPGGYVISTVISNEDEYYRQFMGNERDLLTITDPINNITKRLYTETEIKDFFEVKFDLIYFVKLQFQEEVMGKSFLRSVLVQVLRKPNQPADASRL